MYSRSVRRSASSNCETLTCAIDSSFSRIKQSRTVLEQVYPTPVFRLSRAGLRDRNPPEQYINLQTYERYLANNPHNEFRSVFPVHAIALPSVADYVRHDIELELKPRVQVFELCRFVADIAREQVLATPEERRVSILPEMEEILLLEEWHHPNVVDDEERPSGSETFQQLAGVLATGDVGLYQPSQPPNTHWRNWPEGGSL